MSQEERIIGPPGWPLECQKKRAVVSKIKKRRGAFHPVFLRTMRRIAGIFRHFGSGSICESQIGTSFQMIPDRGMTPAHFFNEIGR